MKARTVVSSGLGLLLAISCLATARAAFWQPSQAAETQAVLPSRGVDGREGPQGRVYARADDGPIDAFIVILRLRGDLYGQWRDTGAWPDDPEANRALRGHSEYWGGQLEAGRALFAAGMGGDYWDNVAFIVFEASSEEEAREIVARDPAVSAYVFQADVRPLTVHFISDKY